VRGLVLVMNEREEVYLVTRRERPERMIGADPVATIWCPGKSMCEREQSHESPRTRTTRAGTPTATERSYDAGVSILIEDGEPSDALYVVRSGVVELVHADMVVDVLEPGQCFGHPSLLSGMAPAFSVRTREPTTCVIVPADAALRVFAHPSGARYIARSLRHRLVQTGRIAHALPDLSLTRLGGLVLRRPVLVEPDAPVRDVAAAMGAVNASAALARTHDGLRLVTDRDLRDRILAAGSPADAPVALALRSPRVVLDAGPLPGAVDAAPVSAEVAFAVGEPPRR